jgi:hypothetical protein
MPKKMKMNMKTSHVQNYFFKKCNANTEVYQLPFEFLLQNSLKFGLNFEQKNN